MRRPRCLTSQEKYTLLIYHDGIIGADRLKANMDRDGFTRFKKYNAWIRYQRIHHPERFVR